LSEGAGTNSHNQQSRGHVLLGAVDETQRDERHRRDEAPQRGEHFPRGVNGEDFVGDELVSDGGPDEASEKESHVGQSRELAILEASDEERPGGGQIDSLRLC
jgi:hypothetical protein